MSWVFLAGDRVYKLKKPVRFPYLDFSTLQRREAACRAELDLNRRLAPDVYLGRRAARCNARGLSLGGSGTIVDWLVVMRRLDESQTLEHVIEERRVETWQLDRLAATLVQFYRRAKPVLISPARLAGRLAAEPVVQSPGAARSAPRMPSRARHGGSMACSAGSCARRRGLLAQRVRERRDRRRARRPASRAHLARRPRQDHRLPGVQSPLAGGRSGRRDRIPEP